MNNNELHKKLLGDRASTSLSTSLGSSSVTTDANGVKTASALYKAFGETRYTSGILGTDYHFTGQRNDSYIKLYFYGSRYYDPELGRFIQPDSIVPASSQGTQAWDRYAFVNNNPVRYTDPTGHMSCEEDGYCPDDESSCPSDAENCGEAEDLITMLWLAFGGIDEIYLTDDALQLIQSDPRFLEFRSELMAAAIRNPEFGKGDFTFSSGTRSIEFGGERDPGSMFMQLLNPGEHSATQAVGSNELSWMIRHADVSADIQVSKSRITISYSLSDQFDLTPSKDRSPAYNLVTHVLGSIWHGALGASKPYVYANWTTCWGFSC
jgi:RHS repeat-associated protein